MISILAVGDLHFKADNSDQTNRLCIEVCKVIRENNKNLKAVVVLGDILHRHDKIDLFSYHRAIRFLTTVREELDRLSEISSFPIKLFVLIGNHDRPNNTTFLTDEHAFTGVKLWKNTIVVDTPKEYSFGEHNFLFVPYVQPGRFFEALGPFSEGVVNKSYSCVFAHQEFKGCKLGPIVSTEGDVYPLDASLCVSGHIHEYSCPQPNIIYVGTPFKTGWSSCVYPIHEEGSVSLLGFTTNVLPSLSNFTHTRIKIRGIPVNILVTFDSSYDFFSCVQAARIEEERSSIIEKKSVKRPITCNLLLKMGYKGDLNDVNMVKIKIKCSSREEFVSTVFNTQERVELSHEGVSVISDVVSSLTLSKGCTEDKSNPQNLGEEKSFRQELISSFKEDGISRETVDFFIKTFPEFKTEFA